MECDVDFISCLETQLLELETIECIFTKNELKVSDEATIANVRDLCQKFRSRHDQSNLDDYSDILEEIVCLNCISLDINLCLTNDSRPGEIPKNILGINFCLPHGYPKELPKVFVHSDMLSREQQGLLNASLKEYIQDNNNGEEMIYQITDWLRENCEPFFLRSVKEKESNDFGISNDTSGLKEDNVIANEYADMWLYMHHIYNKEKRKNIISWAKELELSGFSLPGKPGIVYVEGIKKNVDEYFARLRRLPWKRMSCIQKEAFVTICRKFCDFQELNFDAHGSRDYHMDMGKFHTFLKEHSLGSMFNVLFGIKDEQ